MYKLWIINSIPGSGKYNTIKVWEIYNGKSKNQDNEIKSIIISNYWVRGYGYGV